MIFHTSNGSPHRGLIVGLSEEEKNELRSLFLAELEKEHSNREERALRKREKRQEKQLRPANQRSSEVSQLRSEIRRRFYEEKGYTLEKDQTGRDMWLSPSEQENKKNKRARRKRSHSSKKNVFSVHKKALMLYFFIIVFAVLLGLIITK